MILRLTACVSIMCMNIRSLEPNLIGLNQNLQQLDTHMQKFPTKPLEKQRVVASLERVIDNFKDIWKKANKVEAGWNLTDEEILTQAFGTDIHGLKADWEKQDFSRFDNESQAAWEQVRIEFEKAKNSVVVARGVIVERQEALQLGINLMKDLNVETEKRWGTGNVYSEWDWFQLSENLDEFGDIGDKYGISRKDLYLDLRNEDPNVFKSDEEKKLAKQLIKAIDQKWNEIKEAAKSK